MIRTRFKKILLVAADNSPERLLADYQNVKHVTAIGSIFPSIYEMSPDMIILDYDYIGKDIEEILRRIKVNKFYSRLKICCYKNTADVQTDSLLKALGADYVVYREGLAKPQKNKSVFNSLATAFDAPIVKWMTSV
jgi:hypothetical protein